LCAERNHFDNMMKGKRSEKKKRSWAGFGGGRRGAFFGPQEEEGGRGQALQLIGKDSLFKAERKRENS